MQIKVNTLFQRLILQDKGLNFDYMGHSEYEWGSAHNALNLLVNDLGVSHEVIETNLVLTKDQSPIRAEPIDKKSYAWKRLDKYQREREIRERTEIESLLDGKPLLLLHVPSLTDKEDLAELMSAQTLGDLSNTGGLWHQDTRAWLCINPVAGILYHPSREPEVKDFLSRILEVRREKEPDDAVRADNALKKAIADQQCGINGEAARTLLDNMNAPAPSP